MENWKTKEINNVVYYISDKGNVKTNKNNIKLREDKDGYLVFTGGKKHHRTCACVHRLVAELFIPNGECKPEVHHKDFNRKNNLVENLKWVTHDENIKCSSDDNSFAFKDIGGENNPNAKLTRDDVVRIRELLFDNYTVADIARMYKRGWQTINHIKQNNTWSNV